MGSLSPDDAIALMSIANEYLIDGLIMLVTRTTFSKLSDENLVNFLRLANAIDFRELRDTCYEFIRKNISSMKIKSGFRDEILESPDLALAIVDALSGMDVVHLFILFRFDPFFIIVKSFLISI